MEHMELSHKSSIVPAGPVRVRTSSHAGVSYRALHLFDNHSTQNMCCLLDCSVYTIRVFNPNLRTPLDDTIKNAQGIRIALQVIGWIHEFNEKLKQKKA